MDININHLKKSMALNQLIQLEGKQKEQLVDNPATIIIVPFPPFRNQSLPCSTKITRDK